MTVTFDPSADFADVVDGLEAVTLKRRGTSTTDAVASALQRAVMLKEAAASNGKVTTRDVVWHLPIEELATAPRMGDVILDGNSERWTVLEVSEQTLSGRWRCVSRNLRVVYGLNDTVVIEQATYSKGDGGAGEKTWHVWKTGVRARIQPGGDARFESQATEAGVDAGAQRTMQRFLILMEDDYVLNHSHRIKDREGNVYRILNTTGREDIGQPMTVEVEKWRSS